MLVREDEGWRRLHFQKEARSEVEYADCTAKRHQLKRCSEGDIRELQEDVSESDELPEVGKKSSGVFPKQEFEGVIGTSENTKHDREECKNIREIIVSTVTETDNCDSDANSSSKLERDCENYSTDSFCSVALEDNILLALDKGKLC